ncbi:MAG: VWA domain-containing protein [Candidatus Levyibacteriota bacterium]
MKRFKDRRKVVSLTLVGIAYALIIIPLVVSNVQKQQELRSHAATLSPAPASASASTQQACGVAITNTMLILDRSTTMSATVGYSASKVSGAIEAANKFVDLTAQNVQNEIGLVSFATSATTDSPITSDFSSVKSKINAITGSGESCLQCAINQANQAIASGKRDGKKNVVVLLTDGKANYVQESYKQATEAQAQQMAMAAAQNGHNENGTIFFVIGVGDDANTTFLQQLATSTGGQYYAAPTTDNLSSIYSQISQIIAKGSVSGFLFNDANHNSQYDQGESKLPGWSLQLTQQGSYSSQTFTTDATGHFMIPNLCNGTYTLKEVPQSDWTQTVPADPNGYAFTVTGCNALTDKIFGNIHSSPSSYGYQTTPTQGTIPTVVATATPAPTSGATTMNITVSLDGIGNRGDNTNPNDSSLSNKNPQRKSLNASIQIYDLSNELVAKGEGTITYNSAKGTYQGPLTIQSGFPSGQYIIKITADNHLRKRVDGVQSITAGQANTIKPVSLVTGDDNNDNTINILDYNLLLNCYSDINAATKCSSTTVKYSTDMNDDGSVNQVDYNLFLRELATQPGE